MSLFGIFHRARADRSPADTKPVLPEAGPQLPATTPRSAAGLGIRISDRPRTLALSRDAELHRLKVTSPLEDFDLLNPPPFRDIFHLCSRITPAHTCLTKKTGSTGKSPIDGDSDEALSEKGSPNGASGLVRKIFALTKNGYIMQYADRGPSGRLPERIQKLAPTTIAIASDLVPGQAYTVLVADSADLETLSRPDQATFLSKLKGGSSKRSIPRTLIIVDSPTQLEEWLTAVRKEIQRLSKPETPTLEALPRFEPLTPSKRGEALRRKQAHASAITVQTSGVVDIRTLDVAPSPGVKKHVAELGRVQSPILGRRPRKAQLQVFPRLQIPTETVVPQSKHTPRQDSASSIPTSQFISPTAVTPELIQASSPISLHRPMQHVVQQMPQSARIDRHRPRKDSLASPPRVSPTDSRREADKMRVRKRASLHGSIRTVDSRPVLRSANSFSHLRVIPSPATVDEPVPELPATTYVPPSALQPEGPREGLRLENDEYHAFQQSLNPSSAGSDRRSAESDTRMENDEYHAFQQSLNSSPKPQRSIRSRRHRFSGIPSPGSQQLSFGESSPPRSISARHDDTLRPDAMPRPPSAASTAVVSIKSHLSTRTRGTMASDRRPAALHSASEQPTSRARKRSLTSQHSAYPPTERSMASSRPILRPSVFAPPPPTRSLPTPPQTEDSDSDDDFLVIQTPEPAQENKWPVPPPMRPLRAGAILPAPLNTSRSRSPIRLPPPDLGLPVVALSPPLPPPMTPLPAVPRVGGV